MTKKGFTLIELLVAIAIISMVAALGLTNYRTAQKQARDGKRKSDLQQIRTALEIYYADNTQYPLNLSTLSPDYINPLPSDPKGYTYFYQRITASTYNLCAYLERGGPDDCGDNCGAPGNCNYKVINP